MDERRPTAAVPAELQPGIVHQTVMASNSSFANGSIQVTPRRTTKVRWHDRQYQRSSWIAQPPHTNPFVPHFFARSPTATSGLARVGVVLRYICRPFVLCRTEYLTKNVVFSAGFLLRAFGDSSK